jgi:hypothetical protein
LKGNFVKTRKADQITRVVERAKAAAAAIGAIFKKEFPPGTPVSWKQGHNLPRGIVQEVYASGFNTKFFIQSARSKKIVRISYSRIVLQGDDRGN